jgi:hypothetical protein
MNSKKILNWLITFFLIILFFRFIGLLFRFWYITLPVILLIYYNVRKKIQIIQAQFFGSSGQETQETEDEIIDADFTVVDDEEY